MLLFAFLACGSKTTDTAEETTVDDTSSSEVVEEETTTNPDNVDLSICEDDYALCGEINLPSDFVGETRNLAIALYESIPPAGPPAYILDEIETPTMSAGSSYPIAVHPVLATGEYYLWFNLYMEGGGEWVPVNDIDYTGYVSEPILFSGGAVEFNGVTLEVASGW